MESNVRASFQPRAADGATIARLHHDAAAARELARVEAQRQAEADADVEAAIDPRMRPVRFGPMVTLLFVESLLASVARGVPVIPAVAAFFALRGLMRWARRWRQRKA